MENYEVVVTQRPGSIQCDFEGAKAYLGRQLEVYRGMVFTEDKKKDAKDTVAALRKDKKAFTDRVKEVKGEYMAPYDAFFRQAQELADMFDEPICFINGQIEDFERKRIEEKQKFIRQLYEECISDMADILPLKKIYNPKWENATTTPKAIRAELMSRKEDVKKAIAAIKEMHSDVEEMVLDMYKESFDLTKCIMYITNHEQQKAAILAREQERIRREEEERIRREEREKLEAERRAQEEKEAVIRRAEAEKEELLRQAEIDRQRAVEASREEAAQEVLDSLIPDAEGETSLYEYRLELTADQKEKLELYLSSVGIEWEMI